jgi:hypothetical protein
VVPLTQPREAPFDTTSSSADSAADRPSAPTKVEVAAGTPRRLGNQESTKATAKAPRTAEAQNSTCQSKFSATKAATGSPIAPPIPSEALISAVEEPSLSAGSSSGMMLMPSGMTPAARPCSARPRMNGTRELLRAQTSEPASRMPRLTNSMRRLPYMSSNRPTTGVATAAASKVAVTAQTVSAASACSSCGRSGTIGIASV